MAEQDRNNPLHGVSTKDMIAELSGHYGWEILASQLNVNCFKTFASIKSSHKFLHKTKWARERTEAFYLYKFKQLPIPTDEQHKLPPRERSFAGDLEPQLPAVITETDREFFDDPISGPVFPDKKPRSREAKSPARKPEPSEVAKKSSKEKTLEETSTDGVTPDPWAKWKS